MIHVLVISLFWHYFYLSSNIAPVFYILLLSRICEPLLKSIYPHMISLSHWAVPHVILHHINMWTVLWTIILSYEFFCSEASSPTPRFELIEWTENSLWEVNLFWVTYKEFIPGERDRDFVWQSQHCDQKFPEPLAHAPEMVALVPLPPLLPSFPCFSLDLPA